MKLVVIIFLALFFAHPAIAQTGGGGQTKASESAFTVDTLKAYYDAIAVKDSQILQLNREIMQLNDNHAKDLRDAADKRYEQRFQAQEAATTKATANQNEFRGSLNDLSNTKVSGSEFKLAIESIRQQILDGSKTTDAKLADIQHRLDLREGSSTGIANFVGVGIAIVTVIFIALGYILSTRRNSKNVIA